MNDIWNWFSDKEEEYEAAEDWQLKNPKPYVTRIKRLEKQL